MAKHRPLTCKQVKTILKNLGFEPRPQKRTSHEQWVKDYGGKRYKVTVDCPKEPFTQDLIRSMAHQAGVSKRAFYAALHH
jgi:predicted RNA binding protein YcfA (HicA-like mRNA interferase family)